MIRRGQLSSGEKYACDTAHASVEPNGASTFMMCSSHLRMARSDEFVIAFRARSKAALRYRASCSPDGFISATTCANACFSLRDRRKSSNVRSRMCSISRSSMRDFGSGPAPLKRCVPGARKSPLLGFTFCLGFFNLLTKACNAFVTRVLFLSLIQQL